MFTEQWTFQTYNLIITLSNGEFKVNRSSYDGVSARCFNKSFGFASSNRLEDKQQVIDKAKKLSNISLKNHDLKFNTVRSPLTSEKGYGLPEYDIEQVLNKFRHLDSELNVPELKTRSFKILTNSTFKTYENSEGMNVTYNDIWSYFSVFGVARSGDVMETWSEREGWIGRLDEKDVLDFQPKVITVKDKAISLLKAGHARKGLHTIILDPEMSGLFTHEAVGHACEADSVLGNASVLNKLGEQVGSELVNITDYSVYPNAFGNISNDDEGVRAVPQTLIEKGIVKGYLHSSQTSANMGQKLTGNARMQGYDSPPIIRMRNTIMEPSNPKFAVNDDEVLDVKQGIFVKGMNGGSVDPLTGTFMFGAKEAYNIVNGEMRDHLRDVSITSNIRQTLHNITTVGKTIETGPGFCGKRGQNVRVSDGGPMIRVENMVVG